MHSYVDKLFIFLFGLVFFLLQAENVHAVIHVLFALTLSALLSWLDQEKKRVILASIYPFAALLFPELAFFVPLIAYDLVLCRRPALLLLSLMPLVIHFQDFEMSHNLAMLIALALVFILGQKSHLLESLRQENQWLRDTSVEQTRKLEEQNRRLMENQDREVRLATLHERNRIAREIHDHVGHLLTRALLQVGAMKTLNQDAAVQGNLETLDKTLGESMDEIRRSLHDLRDESIDLESRLREMIEGFESCPVSLDLMLEQPPSKACTVAFLAITREALSNIARHAQAQQAWVTLREHPAFYQLLIRDDGLGLRQSLSSEEGIGLQSMRDRVKALGGQINFLHDTGFEIFVSLPKSEKNKVRE